MYAVRGTLQGKKCIHDLVFLSAAYCVRRNAYITSFFAAYCVLHSWSMQYAIAKKLKEEEQGESNFCLNMFIFSSIAFGKRNVVLLSAAYSIVIFSTMRFKGLSGLQKDFFLQFLCTSLFILQITMALLGVAFHFECISCSVMIFADLCYYFHYPS